MIKKRLNQIKTLIEDLFIFIKLKWFSSHISETDKVLWIDFKNPNLYHRFFYLVIKFYHLSGYKIIYPMSFSKFRNLRNGDYYLSLILKKPYLLNINKIKFNKNHIKITDEDFNEKYFEHYFKFKNKVENTFHIPMSFHPLMYHRELWNIEIEEKKERINSVFCYGNFDNNAYLEINKTEFKLLNRIELYHFFKKEEKFLLIKNGQHLNEILNKKQEQQFVFAEKFTYPIPMEEIRKTLSNFNFFLCCPGVVMPLCHNVVEAMSVGTIPIIQEEYTNVMYPHLKHNKNAIIFKNLEELDFILKNIIFNIPNEDLKRMRKNSIKFYEDYLTPNTVVNNINNHLEKETIYLNAEHRSIEFIK